MQPGEAIDQRNETPEAFTRPAVTQADIKNLIKQVRMDPRATNKPVLAVNALNLMVAMNGGYPKIMYHDDLKPESVTTPDEETALAGVGYYSQYRNRPYPLWLYRRNMAEKFAGDYVTGEKGQQIFVPNPFGAYVEGVLIHSKEAEQALMAKKTPHGCSAWVAKVTDVEPLPEAPGEDPAVTVARLEGELAALRAQANPMAALQAQEFEKQQRESRGKQAKA